MRGHVSKPSVDLPNQEKNNSELLIDRTAAIWIGETGIRAVTNKCDHQAGLIERTRIPCAEMLSCSKKAWGGNGRTGVTTYLEMGLMGMK